MMELMPHTCPSPIHEGEYASFIQTNAEQALLVLSFATRGSRRHPMGSTSK